MSWWSMLSTDPLLAAAAQGRVGNGRAGMLSQQHFHPGQQWRWGPW
jgi:hypothetical protein